MSISSRAFQVSLFALSWVVITGLSEVRAQTPIKIGIVSPLSVTRRSTSRATKASTKRGLARRGDRDESRRSHLAVLGCRLDSVRNISPSAVFPARDQGLTDLKLIAGSFNGTTYSIIANAKIQNSGIAQGVQARCFQSPGRLDPSTQVHSQQRGLIYPRDYNLIRAGGTTLRWAALQTQQVDGAILAEPVSLIAVEKGFANLGDAYKLVPGYQLAGVWIRESWVAKNKDVTLRFLRAFHNALKWLHDNRSEALELLPRITTLPKQYVQARGKPTPRRFGPGRQGQSQRTPVGDRFDGRGWIAQKSVRPEDVIDHSYLQEIGAK